jgi:hypothetical protein
MADPFWQSRISGASNPGGYEGFDPAFAVALKRLVEDYERETGQKAGFSSYGRTPEQGREIWERSGHGTKFLAARPGNSRHEYDLEAGRLATASDIPRGGFLDYAHQNAGNYGLEFLKGDAFRRDPVHIQLTRGGGSAPVAAPHGMSLASNPVAAPMSSPMAAPAEAASPVESGLGDIASGFAPKQKAQPAPMQVPQLSANASPQQGQEGGGSADLLAQLLDDQRKKYGLSLMGMPA